MNRPDWNQVRADLALQRQRQGLPGVIVDDTAMRAVVRILRPTAATDRLVSDGLRKAGGQ